MRLSNVATLAIVALLSACGGAGRASSTATSAPTASPALTFETDAQARAREARAAAQPSQKPRALSRPTASPSTDARTDALNNSDDNARLRQLVDTYDGLESRVTSIIDSIANGANAAAVVGDVGQTWYGDERAFQSAIDKLPFDLNSQPQYVVVKGDLAEAEGFLYAAGADAMGSCDPENGRRELHVADYFMRAVRKQLDDGRADTDLASDPPQVDSSEHECDQ